MTAGFHFEASCPRCGGELLTDGYKPRTRAGASYHDARCDRCCDVYRVTVTAKIIERWPVDKLDRDHAHIEANTYAADILDTAAFR